jgi:hypothetical protein
VWLRVGAMDLHAVSILRGGRKGMHAKMPAPHCGQRRSRSSVPVSAARKARQSPRLGNTAAHGVASIFEDVLRSAEGCFGVDHPFPLAQRSQVVCESLRVAQGLEIAEEVERSGGIGLLQRFQK